MAERARMEEVLRPLGVTLHQYTALSILERREGLSSAQLARRHYVTPQAMHQLVATMERDGLIERRPDEANRRILRAWLTGRGAEVLRPCHRRGRRSGGADAAGTHCRRGRRRSRGRSSGASLPSPRRTGGVTATRKPCYISS